MYIHTSTYQLYFIVRLVDGPTKYEGRVEVYHDNRWSTMCDGRWDLLDAQVVCRQLGFGRAISYKTRPFYGSGTGRFWLDNIQCTGHELFLDKCERPYGRRRWGNYGCGYRNYAGVQCAPGIHFTLISITYSYCVTGSVKTL